MADQLPHALNDPEEFANALAGRRPAVFLDYDGVLTPIVERPEDARMSPEMRDVVRALADRTPVCVVSGRDRSVVQDLMGVTDLVVAGSHGFDIWHPQRGTLQHPAASGFEDLVGELTDRLRREVGGLDGVQVEPKHASVAVHYRRAGSAARNAVADLVRTLLTERPDEIKVTPGKMVYELQPKIDWNKGRAVDYLIDTLGLNRPDLVPVYLGDDVTDEDAFRALRDRGVGVYVGDPTTLDRPTQAHFHLTTVPEVTRLLASLAL
ncbi:trehalose 6-phosphate phosphatase [Pseudonocardia eucalypti]|uniref:trehalose-phosphatase n=1 Tax=Pseudonocardia eucalypti TaxID=648755 RepID=UPI0016207A43|nr:trehalose 6-phosphate phosphatase [Pseudonocardia eucalypti]